MIRLNPLVELLLSPKRVPLRIIVITTLASVVLLAGALIQGQPLYIVALFTLLPWIPVFAFESIWKVEHYSWVAIFGIIVVLQIGHLGEHIVQVTQLGGLEGTLACPPPVDNPLHAGRAVEAGLRDPGQTPTGISTAWVIRPDKGTGLPAHDAAGKQIVGPAACGVFGQLDLEIVHLIWEVTGWLATLILLVRFPRNIWLWIALVAVSIHSVEHLFISWVFFLETEALYNGAQQLWATTVQGKMVTAHPAGLEPTLLTFYQAGGKNGVLGKGGLVDTLLNTPTSFLPPRAYLHFWYNFVVFVPTMVAFLVQLKQIHDEYLARALPDLNEAQLTWATTKLALVRYQPGEIILAQGGPPDRFYIITKGQVEVLHRRPSGREKVVDRLKAGQYFGEMGLLQRTRRSATIRANTPVEALALDRPDFEALMAGAAESREALEYLVGERARGLLAIRNPN